MTQHVLDRLAGVLDHTAGAPSSGVGSTRATAVPTNCHEHIVVEEKKDSADRFQIKCYF